MTDRTSLDWESLSTAELERIESALDQWNLLPDAPQSEDLSKVLPDKKLIPYLRHRLEELSTVAEFVSGSRDGDGVAHPERIGPVEITGVIARGAICDVFRGRQQEPRRDCAVKLQHGASSNPRAKRSFRREVGILAKLDHPYIAQVYFAGEEVNSGHHQMYFAMEYVDGVKLSQYADGGGLSVQEIVGLFILVCEGIGHAHQGGVIHRDLKPANIMVRRDGVPKILDFGIATWNETTATQHSQYGSGTPGYMSPEQFSADSRQDTRSDIYSLGVILYKLLCGDLPYEDRVDSMVSAAKAISTGYRVPLRSRWHDCPKDLAAVVDQCLQQDPQDRYQSVQALADDLRSYLAGDPVKARSWHWVERTRRFVSKYRWVTATSAMALLFLVVGAAVSFSLWRLSANTASELAENNEQLSRARDNLAEELAFRDRSAVNHTLATADRNWDQSPDLVRQWLQDAQGIRDGHMRFAERVQWHRTTRLIREINVSEFAIVDLAYSPDGSRLLSVRENGHVVLWDLGTGKDLWRRRLGIHDVPMCQFSPGGEQVLLIDNGELKTLDVNSGETLRSLDNPVRRVESAVYSPGGEWIATWSPGYGAEVWDASLNQRVQTFEFPTKSLAVLGFSADGREVLVATPNGRLMRGGVEEGEQQLVKLDVQRAHSAAIAGRSPLLALAHLHANLYLFDPARIEPRKTMATRGERIDALTLSQGGRWMMYVTRNRLVARDAASDWERRWSRKFESEPLAVTVNSSEDCYALGLSDGRILHNRFDPLPIDEVLIGQVSRPQRIALARDGSAAVVVGDQIQILDLSTDGAEPKSLNPVGTTVLDACWDADGSVFFATGKRRDLMVARSPRRPEAELEVLHSFPRAIRCVEVDPERQRVFVAMAGGGVTIVDLGDQPDRIEIATSDAHLNALAVDPLTGRFACGDDDGRIWIWDAEGKLIKTLNAHSGAVTDLVFTPNGGSLISGARDYRVRIWDVENLLPPKTIEISLQRVRAVAISPDGESLAISGMDREITICDALTGEFQATLRGHTDSVVDMTFTPDGLALLSLSADGTVRRWQPKAPDLHPVENETPEAMTGDDERAVSPAVSDRTRPDRERHGHPDRVPISGIEG